MSGIPMSGIPNIQYATVAGARIRELERELAQLRAERGRWRVCAAKLADTLLDWKNICDEIDAGYPSAVDQSLTAYDKAKKGTP